MCEIFYRPRNIELRFASIRIILAGRLSQHQSSVCTDSKIKLTFAGIFYFVFTPFMVAAYGRGERPHI